MIVADLFIKDQTNTWVECDKFEEASIRLQDKIKDAKDIGKVFTEFTQQFRLPASKTNNKLFDHYYSVNVLEGFDARRKYDALIKLNGVDYKKGYIKLLGVDLKNEKPQAYRVQFFGEMTSLKDRIGEDMLQDLVGLNIYNHEYNQANVRAGFETSLKYTASSGMAQGLAGEIIYPFISHTRGFTFSTTDGLYDVTQTPPLSSSDRLSYTDLKPAIKVKKVLEAIEDRYGISFSGEFVDGTAKYSPLDDLYLWLHRDKGNVRNGSESTNLNYYATLDAPSTEYEIAFSSGTDVTPLGTYNSPFLGERTFDCELQVVPVGTGNYTISVRGDKYNGDASEYFQSGNLTGTDSLNFTLSTPYNTNPVEWALYIYIEAENTISSITPTLTITRTDDSASGVWSDGSVSLVKDITINVNMPKMKIIDFLTSLFKMFNLVAYTQAESNLTDTYDIILQPYEDFLNSGVVRDITPYVDTSESSVERVTPYKVLRFEYPEPQTYLARKTNEISQFEFGNAFYTPHDASSEDTFLYDGGEYEVKVDFEKMVYERITDTDDGSLSEIIYGWFVNDFSENTPEPEMGKPLLFFNINRSCSTDNIEWSDGDITGDGGTFADAYNAPSNVSSNGNYTLNFDEEIDEYAGTPNSNSLFFKFYKTYIENIYHRETRRKKVKAVLPAKFIYNYKLNDKVVINREPYNIESININLLDGRSELELLKINSFEETFNRGTSFCYAIDYVTEPYWCSPFIDLTDPTKPVLPKGLVSYYRMDNIEATSYITALTVTDSVSDNHGTHSQVFVNNVVTAVNAEGLDYSNDYTTITADASITFIDEPFSVSGYFKFDTTGSLETMFSKQDTTGASNYEWRIDKNASDEIEVYLYTDASNYISIKSTTTLSADTWYHIVVTHDGTDNESGLNIYIDGSVETPQSNSSGTYTGMTDNSLPLHFGFKDATVPTYFNGIMDGVGIWNTELNATNVATIYELQQTNELV